MFYHSVWQNPDQKANRGFVEAVIAEFEFTNSDNRRIIAVIAVLFC